MQQLAEWQLPLEHQMKLQEKHQHTASNDEACYWPVAGMHNPAPQGTGGTALTA